MTIIYGVIDLDIIASSNDLLADGTECQTLMNIDAS